MPMPVVIVGGGFLLSEDRHHYRPNDHADDTESGRGRGGGATLVMLMLVRTIMAGIQCVKMFAWVGSLL